MTNIYCTIKNAERIALKKNKFEKSSKIRFNLFGITSVSVSKFFAKLSKFLSLTL